MRLPIVRTVVRLAGDPRMLHLMADVIVVALRLRNQVG
jgi:hypothetical protein